MRVALVLLTLSLCVKLTLFDSRWFMLALLLFILLLDSTDSMCIWRIWRIENVVICKPLKRFYLISVLVFALCGIITLLYINICNAVNPYTLMLMLFLILVTLFSIKYWVLIDKVEDGLKADEKEKKKKEQENKSKMKNKKASGWIYPLVFFNTKFLKHLTLILNFLSYYIIWIYLFHNFHHKWRYCEVLIQNLMNMNYITL